MKYLILGGGIFGRSLAIKLIDFGVEVVVVDIDEGLDEILAGRVTSVLIADCSDRDAVYEVVSKVDPDVVLVCFGTNFDTTLLSCIYLVELGMTVAARASNPLQAEILRKLGVARVIMPEFEAGERFAEILAIPHSEQIALDAENILVKVIVPRNVVSLHIAELGAQDFAINVVFVHKVYAKPAISKLVKPEENPQLSEHDSLILVGMPRRIAKFLNHITFASLKKKK